jgi:hypothetical protein
MHKCGTMINTAENVCHKFIQQIKPVTPMYKNDGEHVTPILCLPVAPTVE